MLIRFVVTNFLSFDKETEFNMLSSDFRTHKSHVYKAGNKVDVLKASAIYGANGAGKSNLIKAIEFLQEIVEKGGLKKSVNDKKFKLNKQNADKPIELEIEFSIEKKIYSYGLRLIDNIILEEWLYESGVTKPEKRIFERKTSKNSKQLNVKFDEKYYKNSPKKKMLFELLEENLLKPNETVLSKCEQLKIKALNDVSLWIEQKLMLIYPSSRFKSLIPMLDSSDKFKSFTNTLLQTLDTGVNRVDLKNCKLEDFLCDEDERLKAFIAENLEKKLEEDEQILYKNNKEQVLIQRKDNQYTVKRTFTTHRDNDGKEVLFDLLKESDGTRRLIDIIPIYYFMLQEDVTVIVDEIDRSLHPSIIKMLVSKIMADETTKGQFIFTTHESNLLDMNIFRPDEIWFTEKDRKSGGTQLYSLSEFKPRNDLDIQKGYLKGRFGAIPFLANLEDLNWHNDGA